MRDSCCARTGVVVGLTALALILVVNCTRLGSPGRTPQPAPAASLVVGQAGQSSDLALSPSSSSFFSTWLISWRGNPDPYRDPILRAAPDSSAASDQREKVPPHPAFLCVKHSGVSHPICFLLRQS